MTRLSSAAAAFSLASNVAPPGPTRSTEDAQTPRKRAQALGRPGHLRDHGGEVLHDPGPPVCHHKHEERPHGAEIHEGRRGERLHRDAKEYLEGVTGPWWHRCPPGATEQRDESGEEGPLSAEPPTMVW
ncbi:hypothetical protein ACUV84_042385 [Puccinellia chinampoensis]